MGAFQFWVDVCSAKLALNASGRYVWVRPDRQSHSGILLISHRAVLGITMRPADPAAVPLGHIGPRILGEFNAAGPICTPSNGARSDFDQRGGWRRRWSFTMASICLTSSPSRCSPTRRARESARVLLSLRRNCTVALIWPRIGVRELACVQRLGHATWPRSQCQVLSDCPGLQL